MAPRRTATPVSRGSTPLANSFVPWSSGNDTWITTRLRGFESLRDDFRPSGMGSWSRRYDAGMACRQPGFDSRRVHSASLRSAVAGADPNVRSVPAVAERDEAICRMYGREPDTVGRAAVLTQLPLIGACGFESHPLRFGKRKDERKVCSPWW